MSVMSLMNFLPTNNHRRGSGSIENLVEGMLGQSLNGLSMPSISHVMPGASRNSIGALSMGSSMIDALLGAATGQYFGGHSNTLSRGHSGGLINYFVDPREAMGSNIASSFLASALSSAGMANLFR
ncbi:MAG: hypothetical protein PHC51_02840 [bacterium]|nr:hypothetical protein [bacterium]